MILLSVSNNTFALKTNEEAVKEMKATLDAKIGKDPIANCAQNLFERFDLEVAEFLEFIDLNFQNKSANSSLTDIAISRYVEYKNNINIVFANVVKGATAGNLSKDELDSYLACSKIKDAYLEMAKKQMIDHIKNTTAQKNSTILVEKYQAINDRLRDLNFSIARMYGYFVTFKDKLPFYVDICLKK